MTDAQVAALKAQLDAMEQGRREAREERAQHDAEIAHRIDALCEEVAALRAEVTALRGAAITWKKLGAIVGGMAALVGLVAWAAEHISLHSSGG